MHTGLPKQPSVQDARRRLISTVLMTLGFATGFCVLLLFAVANGLSAFQIRFGSGRWPGAGASAPLAILLLLTGLATILLLPECRRARRD